MKQFILFVILMLYVVSSSGQTLHAIVFADTNDQNVGDCDYQDYLNISMEVNTIASAIGMQMKPYFYKASGSPDIVRGKHYPNINETR